MVLGVNRRTQVLRRQGCKFLRDHSGLGISFPLGRNFVRVTVVPFPEVSI